MVTCKSIVLSANFSKAVCLIWETFRGHNHVGVSVLDFVHRESRTSTDLAQFILVHGNNVFVYYSFSLTRTSVLHVALDIRTLQNEMKQSIESDRDSGF